jgi:hypothetical protein
MMVQIRLPEITEEMIHDQPEDRLLSVRQLAPLP